jgi:hypothetical protein
MSVMLKFNFGLLKPCPKEPQVLKWSSVVDGLVSRGLYYIHEGPRFKSR